MTTDHRISVLVYEDIDFLREALNQLINAAPGLHCPLALTSATEVIEDIKLVNPDVILMDIDMPGISGIEAVKLVREKYPDLPIMMQTVFDDNDNVFRAICAGASGYILKKAKPAELIEAIYTLHHGGAPMSPPVAVKVLEMFRKHHFGKNISGDYRLTEKEKTVLNLLVKGDSHKMMAAKLSVTIDAVRFHFKNIYKKLHVNSQAEAVAKALNERLV